MTKKLEYKIQSIKYMDKRQDMEYDPTYLVMHHFIGPWKCGTVCLCDAPKHNDKQCMLCMDTMRETDLVY